MRRLFALSVLVCGVFARPSEEVVQKLAEEVTQHHTQDSAGTYSYSYSSPLSSKSEIRSLDGTTNGEYKYVDPDGKIQSVEYSSDSNGFQVKSATNIPEPPKQPELPKLEIPTPVSDTPEVAEARNQHFEALKQAEQTASQEPIKFETTVINPGQIVSPFGLYRVAPNLQVLPFVSSPLVSLNYEIPGATVTYASYPTPVLPGFSFQFAGNENAAAQQQNVQENVVKGDDDTVTIEAKSADVQPENVQAEEQKKEEGEEPKDKKE